MSFGPDELLLLARAEAGYRNWDGVRSTLEGQPWLGSLEGGESLRLLARAREGLGGWAEAAEAWARYLESPHGRSAADRPALHVRRARALHAADARDGVPAALDSAMAGSDVVASWAALELARGAAEAGDTAALRPLVQRVSTPAPRDRAWELEARGVLAAGDTARALAIYGALAEQEETGSRLGRVDAVLGELLLARGDTVGARTRFLSALARTPGTGDGTRAARRVLTLGEDAGRALGAERALEVARILDRSGDVDRAVRAYDRYMELTADPPEEVRLARARLLARTSGRADDAVNGFRALSTSPDREVGAGALDAWMDLRRRQGRSSDVATIRDWLLERYPSSPQAVGIVFFQGDAAHDRQDLPEALRHYARLQEMAPSLNYSGLARMRMAQIHLHRGDTARAVEVFQGYRADFPSGRRWSEATYWAGRLLLETGQEATGRELLETVRRQEPLSYYAVLAAEALEVPWTLPGSDAVGTPGTDDGEALPAWLEGELVVVDLLEAADLEEGRALRLDSLRARALTDSPATVLALARELIRRDLTIDGINLGWELRSRGEAWSRELLEVLYPFTHREQVVRVARERDLDPILLAALIRQESAFDPDIRSSAGAVGLMQVMPATGRQLARAVGPEAFHPRSLVTPEINLHLGTQYVVDLLGRFDGRLTFVLSAYNAGPTRAREWERFPEASDPLRLVERIPFGETRDYVKQIRRNLAVYEALYAPVPIS